MKEVSIVFMSLSKSVEMRLALWRAPVMQFLFHLVGTSNFQCVGSFPGFLKALHAIELVGITKGSIEEVVRVFLDGENNVRMVGI